MAVQAECVASDVTTTLSCCISLLPPCEWRPAHKWVEILDTSRRPCGRRCRRTSMKVEIGVVKDRRDDLVRKGHVDGSKNV